ncbi:hypothetical protein [Amycolatopsis sp. H20-H5]|uniref:hypothetical protein n=1 Tax=Amycolatopsis sp. H20-H5 TaxID=3046309 RepID=UPI002DB89F49|nr:hypothetical protein [Amycolatopsis sp. H20-H5]MEC3975105.1 hypothetical protein [Amycolatopsis sp. H20-H5]
METRRKELGRHIKSTRRRAYQSTGRRTYRSQKAFAEAIGLHESSVANAEIGSDRVGDLVYSTIEEAFGWPRNSVGNYIAGRTQTLPGDLPDGEGSADEDADPRHEWSAAFRQKTGAMSVDEIIEFGKHIGETSGERARIRYLRAALQVKEEDGTLEPDPARK